MNVYSQVIRECVYSLNKRLDGDVIKIILRYIHKY